MWLVILLFVMFGPFIILLCRLTPAPQLRFLELLCWPWVGRWTRAWDKLEREPLRTTIVATRHDSKDGSDTVGCKL